MKMPASASRRLALGALLLLCGVTYTDGRRVVANTTDVKQARYIIHAKKDYTGTLLDDICADLPGWADC